MTGRPFVEGATYTRRQIHEELGGSIQSYLPRKGGRVVCGCFTTKLNPEAPYIVFVGNKPNVIRDAELFASQSEAVPIFMKKRTYAWEYVGNYVAEYVTDSGDYRKKALEADRPNAVGMLVLHKISP